jgi:tRNA threonylcarbamoyladenosine biosynthesis protein TsaE
LVGFNLGGQPKNSLLTLPSPKERVQKSFSLGEARLPDGQGFRMRMVFAIFSEICGVITQQLTITDVNELPGMCHAILRASLGRKVFAFYGEMGTGKTTIIKQICRELGSHDSFSSPSYSIVNEYLIELGRDKIYHIDLYRLKNVEEALAIGIEEYIAGESYCFIEWPELIEALLPADVVNVRISLNDNMREISIFMK